jgi:hypothetical protein
MTEGSRVIDYTKMELGKVTRTFKGRVVCVIARCPKCGKKGERSSTIPGPEDAWRGLKPHVSVHHVYEVKQWNKEIARAVPMFGSHYGVVKEHCSVLVNRENVDDVFNVEERKRYDAYVAALRARIEEF